MRDALFAETAASPLSLNVLPGMGGGIGKTALANAIPVRCYGIAYVAKELTRDRFAR